MLARSLLAAAREGLNIAPSMKRSISTLKLPDMPYDYGALEPIISGQIMELHHSKHHAAYVANYNKAIEQQSEAEAKGDVAKVIALQSAIKFNGGGERHMNRIRFAVCYMSLHAMIGCCRAHQSRHFLDQPYSGKGNVLWVLRLCVPGVSQPDVFLWDLTRYAGL